MYNAYRINWTSRLSTTKSIVSNALGKAVLFYHVTGESILIYSVYNFSLIHNIHTAALPLYESIRENKSAIIYIFKINLALIAILHFLKFETEFQKIYAPHNTMNIYIQYNSCIAQLVICTIYIWLESGIQVMIEILRKLTMLHCISRVTLDIPSSTLWSVVLEGGADNASELWIQHVKQAPQSHLIQWT